MRSGRSWRIAAVLVAVAAACTGGDDAKGPDGATTTSSTATTIPIDYSSAQLPDIAGRTTTTVDNRPGTSHLHGLVLGPEGPVAGATVRVERQTATGVVKGDLLTLPDGTWDLPNVLGGIYTVRAFRSPDLAQTEPSLFFLTDGTDKPLDLTLVAFNGVSVTAATNPTPPPVGEETNLAVRVANQTVDLQGVVRSTPVAGAIVSLTGSSAWRLESSATAFTDSRGDARFALECTTAGVNSLSAIVNDTTTVRLDIPACEVPVADVPTDDATGSSTSTTRPRTTTTRRISTTTR